MADNSMTITIEGADIFWRNFRGEEGMYNDEGDRSFACQLTEDLAQQMLKDAWNVKYGKPDDDGVPGEPYVTVKVAFTKRPPRIIMIDSKGHRTNMNEETVGLLDWADIVNVDLIIRGFRWEVGGKTGVKAYLQSLYVTVQEDELEAKYAQGSD